MPCIICDMQGLERLIGICRNLPLPISTHSRLLSILSNFADENMAVVIIRYYYYRWAHTVLYSDRI